MKMAVKAVFGVIGGAAASLLGGWDVALEVLIALLALDYVSGVFAAVRNKALSSEVGYKGLVKKAGIIVVIILAAQADRIAPQANGAFRTIACMFYIANEGISILENVCELGLPVPAKLKSMLAQLAQRGEEHE